MSVFAVLDLEALVQSDDKTRLDASRSYSPDSTISSIEISPTGEEEDYVDVTTNGYLDYQFTYDEEEDDDPAIGRNQITISVRVIDADDNESIVTKTLHLVEEDTDNLFSSDDRLRKHEADIMKYLPDGRSTFKDVHRRAQQLILAWLDTQGFIDNLGAKLTLDDFTDTEEVQEWATMMALRLIFESVHNAEDDVFEKKAKKYEGLEQFYRNRATIRIDLNADGVADAITERLDTRSCRVVRR